MTTRDDLFRERVRRERERHEWAEQLREVAILARQNGYTRVALHLEREAEQWQREPS